MPYFGLMKEVELTAEKSLLLRSKSHIRCVKRRLRESKTSAGIATLYDALDVALKWFVKTYYNLFSKDLVNIVDRKYTARYFSK